MYENFLSKYENQMKYPTDYIRGLKGRERVEERRDRALGRGKKYKVNVVLFRQTRKLDPAKPIPDDNYGQTLLRPEKKKNLITRQKILKVLEPRRTPRRG